MPSVRYTTAQLTPPSSPFRRSVAVASYGAPPGAVSSGYGSGAGVDAVVAAEHQHRRQSLTHSGTHPTSPAFPYSSQHSPRAQQQSSYSQYAGDDVSPTYPTSGSSSGGNYTTNAEMPDHFEIPPAKRQKISDLGVGGRRSSQATTAGTDSPAAHHPEGMDHASPSYARGEDASRGREGVVESRRGSESVEPGPSAAAPVLSKPKRVRTGCLTCRNRHLKCDEAVPVCLNCQKSNRKCERGVRLNFIDLKVEQPPYLLPPVDWKGTSSLSVQKQNPSAKILVSRLGFALFLLNGGIGS